MLQAAAISRAVDSLYLVVASMRPGQWSKNGFVFAALLFSKNVYSASLSSYYTFYLITKFNVSVRAAQVHLFIFLAAVAAGTLLGGPIGDRFGRKHVIWGSILGVLPFTLALPFANLFWTTVLTIVIESVLLNGWAMAWAISGSVWRIS